MASVLGAMTYNVVNSKRTRLIRKRQKSSKEEWLQLMKMRLYFNHEEEASSISDEEMEDGDANIDNEEMVEGDANIDDEEMVDANMDN
ncbi:hypothetical protein Sjap_022052 [Stephania japonica]|uniref:Uncharacterized protein n=1 Tax=Stephania japonica TaxID=461633 RepID=A0AAP0HUN9_9MAGN